VVRYVARHLERARIVTPEAVRDAARADLRKILAAHERPVRGGDSDGRKSGGRK
jgi:hypothetical protein